MSVNDLLCLPTGGGGGLWQMTCPLKITSQFLCAPLRCQQDVCFYSVAQSF